MDQPTLNFMRDALTKMGFTNGFLIKGIIAEVYTETGFALKAEMSYRNTPTDRLRTIFGRKLAAYSDNQLNVLKRDDIKFFDAIYGGMLGNTSPGDGFKYRGRGYNQITFKTNYQNIGSAIQVDLVNHPDELMKPSVASLSLAEYYKQTFHAAIASGAFKAKLNITDPNQITTPELGVKTALQANAGFGKDLSTPFFQGVYQKALAIYPKIVFT